MVPDLRWSSCYGVTATPHVAPEGRYGVHWGVLMERQPSSLPQLTCFWQGQLLHGEANIRTELL